VPALAWLRPVPAVAYPTRGRHLPVRQGGGSRYGLAALRREAADVRRVPVGERNNRLNRAVFSLGMLTAGGELHEDLVADELLAAALTADLPEREARASTHSGLRAEATNHATGR